MPNHLMFSFGWVSWSSIVAGAVTALAVWIVMAIVGLALGFKTVEPKSNDPVSGLGKTLGSWYAISIIVGMAAGGYMAGLFAARRGLEHGFLVWAVVTIILICFSGHAIGATVRGLMAAVRGVGSGVTGAAGAATSLGKSAAQAASNAVNRLQDSIHLDLSTDEISDKLNDNVVSVLRDTGEEKLQPEYLKQQVREARGDVKKLLRQLSLNPTEAGSIISNFLDNEKSRLQNLTGDIDKDTAVTTLMNHRGIPRDEAEKMVDNAVNAYGQAVDKAKETLADINDQIEDTKNHLKDIADQARDKADKMTNTAAKGAAATAAALILAALICMGFGLWGAKCANHWYAKSYHHYMMGDR